MNDGILTLSNLLDLSKRVHYHTTSFVGQQVLHHTVAGIDYGQLESVSFDPILPDRVATLNGLDIFIDDELRIPRMIVSLAFRRIQTQELVEKTQFWMTEFFGLEEYPVMRIGNRLVMPMRTLEKLRTELEKGPGYNGRG